MGKRSSPLADTSDKTEEPSEHKLSEARKKGQIFQSQDVVTAVCLFVTILVTNRMIPKLEARYGEYMKQVIALVGEGGNPIGRGLARDFLKMALVGIIPICLSAAIAAILATGVQTRFLNVMDLVKPKFSRLNPANGIKNIFSLRNLISILKNILKIVIIVALAYSMIKNDIVTIARTLDMGLQQSASILLKILYDLLMRVCLVFAVIAAVDFMFEKRQYHKQMMMTKQEVKDEYKMLEGNPEIKGRIKNIQRQRARERMMQDVPKADVVVRNPTHVSVALKYEPKKSAAPIVVAKGLDSLALRIAKVAEENGVPCVENVTLARALYGKCKIGGEIPPEYYGAVAELLVFIYRQQGRLDTFTQDLQEGPEQSGEQPGNR